MRCFFIFCCFSIALAVKLPSSIKLCSLSQPDLSKCVGKAIQTSIGVFKNGYEELGLPAVEPYYVDKIGIETDSKSQFSLQLKFMHVYIHGLSNLDVLNTEVNFDSCRWIVDISSPVLTMVGDYELEANIIFPIKAHGKFNTTQIKLVNRHKMNCEFYEKAGKKHMKLTNYTMDMRPENVIYDFKDVFPSNKQIETEISNTLNENSLAIFKEAKPSIDATFAKLYMDVMNIVWNQIPFDELFLP